MTWLNRFQRSILLVIIFCAPSQPSHANKITNWFDSLNTTSTRAVPKGAISFGRLQSEVESNVYLKDSRAFIFSEASDDEALYSKDSVFIGPKGNAIIYISSRYGGGKLILKANTVITLSNLKAKNNTYPVIELKQGEISVAETIVMPPPPTQADNQNKPSPSPSKAKPPQMNLIVKAGPTAIIVNNKLKNKSIVTTKNNTLKIVSAPAPQKTEVVVDVKLKSAAPQAKKTKKVFASQSEPVFEIKSLFYALEKGTSTKKVARYKGSNTKTKSRKKRKRVKKIVTKIPATKPSVVEKKISKQQSQVMASKSTLTSDPPVATLDSASISIHPSLVSDQKKNINLEADPEFAEVKDLGLDAQALKKSKILGLEGEELEKFNASLEGVVPGEHLKAKRIRESDLMASNSNEEELESQEFEDEDEEYKDDALDSYGPNRETKFSLLIGGAAIKQNYKNSIADVAGSNMGFRARLSYKYSEKLSFSLRHLSTLVPLGDSLDSKISWSLITGEYMIYNKSKLRTAWSPTIWGVLGFERYNNSISSSTSSTNFLQSYTSGAIGFRSRFPMASRWDIGGDLLATILGNGYKLHVQGDLRYLWKDNYILGSGYWLEYAKISEASLSELSLALEVYVEWHF